MPPRVAIGSALYAVVPARDVLEHMTESDAHALLHRLLHDDPAARSHLRRLAEDLDFTFFGGTREAIAVVARAIAQGRIVPVRLRSAPRRLDSPSAVDLREIADTLLPSTLIPDRPGPSDDPDPSPADTWVSFEVVDDEGRPAHGDFRLVVDATGEEGELDARRHHRGEIREGADVRLRASALRWPSGSASPRPVSPARGSADDGPSARRVSFELLDDEGEPLVATWVLHAGDREVASGSGAEASEPIADADADIGAAVLHVSDLRTAH